MNSDTYTGTGSPGNLRDFLNILFKHKSKIIIIFLTTVLTVTVVTFLMSPIYQASSQLLVKFGRENVYSPANITATGSQVLFDLSKEDRINSEVEILKGRNLIKKVVSDLGVKKIYPDFEEKTSISVSSSKKLSPFEKAVLIFQKRLSVEGVKKSDIINVTFQHKDPVIAAQVVNKLIDVFLEHHIKVYKQAQNYDFFDDQVKLLEKKLKDSEDELETFRNQHTFTSLQEQKNLLLKQISDIEVELSKTRSEISENMVKIQVLNGHLSEPLAESKLGRETDDLNPDAISAIRSRLSELKLREQELLSKYDGQYQLVVNVRKEIEKAKQLLSQEERTYYEKAITSISDTLKALKGKEDNQKQHLAQYQQELNRITSVEMRLNELERQFKMDEDNYQLYVKKMEEARISDAMDTQKIANISITEPALPPIKPVKPNKLRNVILAIILGGTAGLGAAFFSEYTSQGLITPERAERQLGLPVIATVPYKR
jgi:uncharacterized protein involved in exopolysaccharide biosynthesis